MTESSQIETLFDELCDEFIKPEMRKYINMETLRKDFVSKINDSIDEIVSAISEKDQGLYDLVNDLSTEVPFGFDCCEPGSPRTYLVATKIEEFLMNIMKL